MTETMHSTVLATVRLHVLRQMPCGVADMAGTPSCALLLVSWHGKEIYLLIAEAEDEKRWAAAVPAASALSVLPPIADRQRLARVVSGLARVACSAAVPAAAELLADSVAAVLNKAPAGLLLISHLKWAARCSCSESSSSGRLSRLLSLPNAEQEPWTRQ